MLAVPPLPLAVSLTTTVAVAVPCGIVTVGVAAAELAPVEIVQRQSSELAGTVAPAAVWTVALSATRSLRIPCRSVRVAM
jgi:hypothetical protein